MGRRSAWRMSAARKRPALRVMGAGRGPTMLQVLSLGASSLRIAAKKSSAQRRLLASARITALKLTGGRLSNWRSASNCWAKGW